MKWPMQAYIYARLYLYYTCRKFYTGSLLLYAFAILFMMLISQLFLGR